MPIEDPSPTRIRAEASLPRRRASDPTPRRREDDHKPGNGRFAALMTVVVAVLFLGYVFNVAGFATAADQVVRGWNASAQSHNDAVVQMVALAFPAACLLVAALVMYGLLQYVLRGLKSSRKNRTLANREVISLDTFKRITEARGIRPRIATQAYELMLPHYRHSMRARLDDRLVEDLHMKPAQIQDVYANLLHNTDRRAPVDGTPSLVTIMDLLNAVQNAKRQSLMNSFVRPAARLSGMVRTRRMTAEKSEKVAS